MRLPRHPRFTGGFSLPFVLIAAFVLLLGGLMLALRSSDSLLSTLLQRENNDARDAAETGITRIVGELNRPHNRGLLVKPQEAGNEDDSANYLWTSADAVQNPCLAGRTDAGSQSDLTSNPSIGYKDRPLDSKLAHDYNPVYLDGEGRITTKQLAVRAYRLISVQRQRQLRDDGSPSLRIFQAAGRGTVTLLVEGYSMRHGTAISSVRLEQQLELVPKCCNASFGGSHGSVDYTSDSRVCIDMGWGFVAGIAGDDSGSLTINGVTTIKDDGTGEGDHLVNPLTCVATAPDQCAFNPTSTPYTIRLAAPFPRPVPENPAGITVLGTISSASQPQPYPSSGSAEPFLYCETAGETPTSLKKCPGGKVVINAASDDLPVADGGKPYCGQGNYVEIPEASEALHCNIKLLDYSQIDITVKTGGRALRLYFPEAGDVIRSTGGGSLSHEGGEASRFALFGCPSCLSQAVKLAGGTRGLELFAWFPRGQVTVVGGSEYEGVIWANGITSSGGVTWTIPVASVLPALRMAGFDLAGSRNPPVFDWVARSVRSFSWSGL